MFGPPVVERDRELAVVRAFVEDVGLGGAVLLLGGPVGIGKSALWREAVRESRERSYRILSFCACEPERDLPYNGLADLFEPVLHDEAMQMSDLGRHALHEAFLRNQATLPAMNHRAVCLTVLDVLRQLASSGPVVLAVDDVHWLDPQTTSVLAYAVRRLDAERVGLVFTVNGTGDNHLPLGLDRAPLAERIRRLAVAPLDVDGTDELLRSRLGLELPRPMLLEVHRASGGNPLFALEIARSVAPLGHFASWHALTLTEGLAALIRPQLRGLSPDAKRALFVVAALGEPTVSLVKAVLGEQVVSALADAADAGVLEVDGDRLRFAQPLLAGVVYQDLEPRRRREMHRHMASALRDPTERARHLALATIGTDPTVALLLENTATRARARGATASAAQSLELALRITPGDDRPALRRRTLEAAETQFLAGNLLRARALLQRMLPDCPGGVERARALRVLGTIEYHDGRFEPALDLLAEALIDAGNDAALSSSLHRDLAWVRCMQGRLGEANQHAAAAVQVAERLESSPLLAEALTALAWTEALRGKGEPIRTVERATALQEWTESVAVFRHPGVIHGVLLKWADDFEGARTRLRLMLEQAEARGDQSSLPYILDHLAELECWAGNWRRALALAEDGCRASRQTGQRADRALALYASALVHAYLGALDRARELAEEGSRLADSMDRPIPRIRHLSVLGFVELTRGDLRAAAGFLEEAEDIRAGAGIVEPGVTRFTPNLIEALIGIGKHERAERLIDDWEARGRRLARPRVLAGVFRYRGLLRASRGDLAGGIEMLEVALRLHEPLPATFELARTLLLAGEVRRRAKQKREARLYLGRAVSLFEGLGATPWTRRAEAEMARIGGRRTSGSDLTPTEQRVAALVARGFTNREVADALFVSPKTVAANLLKIYPKVGVRSRTELAGKLSAEGREQDGAPALP